MPSPLDSQLAQIKQDLENLNEVHSKFYNPRQLFNAFDQLGSSLKKYKEDYNVLLRAANMEEFH